MLLLSVVWTLLCLLVQATGGFVVRSTIRPVTASLFSESEDVNEPEPEVFVTTRKTNAEGLSVLGALGNVLKLASTTGRGEFATESEKKKVTELVSFLELSNPTPRPTESVDMQGRWELVYSSTQLFRSSPFFMAGRAVCETDDQAKQYDWFCDMHRAALAISNIGSVRQIVSGTRLVSEFEVKAGAVPFLSDFTPFQYSGGWPVSRCRRL